MIETLETILKEVTHALGYGKDTKVILSNRPELCDYQCDDAFKLAKEFHKSPNQIGNDIVSALQQISDFDAYFSKVEFAPPGFINMKVSDAFINRSLEKMNASDRFGIKPLEKVETYVIDYGGANIAKPLHVGHMRTAMVGESIKRIVNFMGHKTISDVHLGDYGLQIGQVIYGILEDGIQADEITLEYLERTYPKISGLCKEKKEVKEKCELITKELQEGNVEYNQLLKRIRKVSGDDLQRLYTYLGVSFDLWQGESDAYPYIKEVESYLKKDIKESDGAKIIEVKDELGQELPPLLFEKSNGGYLYATTDLATIYDRMHKYDPSHILYIVDNRQSLHFKQVFSVCRESGLTPNTSLEFLGYGTVNGADGKPFKTRSGDAPKLDSLFATIAEIFISKKESNKDMKEEDIHKIVNSILKFADLQNSRDRDYIFDISKFGDVVGKTGPYILYTYLRIQKIIEKESINTALSDTIYGEVDRKLRLHLLGLEAAVTSAFLERKPHYIADFIYNTAVLTNTFYQYNHIEGLEDQKQKDDWVYVLILTNRIIKELLDLIVIEIPSFM